MPVSASDIQTSTTFPELIANPHIWPAPFANYEAVFCDKIVYSTVKVPSLFPCSNEYLKVGLLIRGSLQVSLDVLKKDYYVSLSDYTRKANIIAQAMKHEYDSLNFAEKSVDQLLTDQQLLKKCSYTPYIINMISQIYRQECLVNRPFICILAPSCTGKTQLAFVLDYFSKFPFATSLFKKISNAANENERLAERPTGIIKRDIFFHCVIHLICSFSSSGDPQDIYCSFFYSRQFLKLLARDFKNIKDGSTSLSKLISGTNLKSEDNLELEFKSLGFLKRLIQERELGDPWALKNEMTTMRIEAISLENFRNYIEKRKKPVVICLDEFGSNDQSRLNLLFFCRNLLREAHCVVITMGTNLKATNLLNASGPGGASRRGEPIPWVYLISELPKLPFGIISKCYQGALNLLNSKPNLKKWILRTSNDQLANNMHDPLLITDISGILDCFLRELNLADINLSEIDILNATIQPIITWILERKDTIDQPEAILGQFLLHFAFVESDGTKYGRRTNLPSVLINDYFTSLCAVPGHCSLPLKLFRKVNLDKKRRPYLRLLNNPVFNSSRYIPRSYFSEFVDNELVYLILLKIVLSDSGFDPNDQSKDDLLELNSNHSIRFMIEKKFYAYMETSQTSDSRDGSFLENLGLASMVRTSILGPYSGQTFGEFFLGVCKQLSLEPINKATFDSSILGSTAEFVVPFLAPVNTHFSTNFRSIEGVYSGIVISPRDKAQIDGIAIPSDLVTSSLCKIARRQLPTIPGTKNKEFVPTTPAEFIADDLNFQKNGKDGLVITAEMKNYSDPLGYGRVKACFNKAMKFKREYFDSNPHIKKHVHLMFVSTTADWKLLKAVDLVEPVAKKHKLDDQKVVISSSIPPASMDMAATTDPAEAITIPKDAVKKVPQKKEFNNCRFFMACFDKVSSRIYLKEFAPIETDPKEPVSSESGPMPETARQADKVNSKDAKSTAAQQESKGIEKVTASPLDINDKGKEKVADGPVGANAEAQQAQDDKKESTDHLLDFIVIPIEDMFGHPLV